MQMQHRTSSIDYGIVLYGQIVQWVPNAIVNDAFEC